MDQQLKKIVDATRAEMESFAREHQHIGFEGSDEDLSCYCAIASYFLVMMGRKFGYNLSLVEGAAFEGAYEEINEDDLDILVNHCWVEYKGTIIDLSAKQFNPSLQKVHVVSTSSDEYWASCRGNEVRKNMKFEWPHDQSPYSYLKELRKRANELSIKIAA